MREGENKGKTVEKEKMLKTLHTDILTYVDAHKHMRKLCMVISSNYRKLI